MLALREKGTAASRDSGVCRIFFWYPAQSISARFLSLSFGDLIPTPGKYPLSLRCRQANCDLPRLHLLWWVGFENKPDSYTYSC